MSYIVAIAVLAALILVHELGHMWVARWCGMRVERFSIFFGPVLFSWQGKRTRYQVAAIPIGGFVQIAGMNPHEALPADDSGSYANKAAWKRFATVLAGPAINYLLAIVLMLAVTLGWGLPAPRVVIQEVVDGSAAAAAGLKANDIIAAIDGVAVHGQRRVLEAVQGSEGGRLRFEVERQGKPVTLQVVPAKEDGTYRIGIRFGETPGFMPVGLGAALGASLLYPVLASAEALGFLKKLVTRDISPKQVGGPVEIVAQLSGSVALGWVVVLLMAAKLNVVLGLFNLLPLPALDGGRLVFLGAEILTGRRVNQRFEFALHTIGFLLLLALILLVTYGDIRRRFG